MQQVQRHKEVPEVSGQQETQGQDLSDLHVGLVPTVQGQRVRGGTRLVPAEGQSTRNFSGRTYDLLDQCRDLAEAGDERIFSCADQLRLEISSHRPTGILSRRRAKGELRRLVDNCLRNARDAASWAEATGDERLREQSRSFQHLTATLGAIHLP